MTKLIALTCNHCGAPLKVPGETRFLTCGHCASHLEVQRSGDAIFTKVLEALDKRTAALANDVEILKLQNDLELLDREWAVESQPYMNRSKNGTLSEPTTEGAVFFAVVIVLVGLMVAIFGGHDVGPGAIVPGLGIIAFGGIWGRVAYSTAQDYQFRNQSYQCQRGALFAKIHRLSHSGQ